MNRLSEIVRENKENQDRILREAKINENQEEENEVDLTDSPIFRSMIENKKVEEFTNFSENEMMDIWRRVEPKVIASRRGPCPKISALDSTVLLLVFYKTNLDFGL